MFDRPHIRLLHSSDIHLGDGGLGARPSFRAVIDAGRALSADALLLPGDIFDHARVSDEEILAFLAEVSRFERPVIALPGNHDTYDDSSIYRRGAFLSAPSNLFLLSEVEGGSIYIEELHLEVWGRPTVSHEPGFRPLINVPLRRNNSWYVALGHGHFLDDPVGSFRSSPIFPQDIASAPCDYIALGHWEGFRDVSQGEVPAFYSGSPRVRIGQDQAWVLVVGFGPQGVDVVRHAITYTVDQG